MFYISGTHAQAVNDRVAFKISGGWLHAGSLLASNRSDSVRSARSVHRAQNAYPNFTNQGTTQPKFDGRVDYDYPDGKKLSFSGGVAGTDGIMHTGIGPFDIDRGSVMGYGKVNFTNKGFRAGFFTNLMNGDAANLLSVDPTGQPIGVRLPDQDYDFEASNVQAIENKHVLTYGGNLRFNSFDLSIAPNAENRTEGGAYAQDEIFLGEPVRLVVGARVDRFDYLDDFVFSPRVALMVKPQENHTVRLSYNRAYRSPSVINNFLDITITEPLNLGLFSPALAGRIYLHPDSRDRQHGALRDLRRRLRARLQRRRGQRPRHRVGRVLREQDEGRYFLHRADRAPLDGDQSAARLAAAACRHRAHPRPEFSRRVHLPELRQDDAEGVRARRQHDAQPQRRHVRELFVPGKPTANFALTELNLPAKNRFNIGFNFNRGRFLGDINVSYSDSAFWQDVLDDRYHGTTESYTLAQRRVWREVAERQAHDVDQGHQPREPDHPAARVRRHHQALAGRRTAGEFLRSARVGAAREPPIRREPPLRDPPGTHVDPMASL